MEQSVEAILQYVKKNKFKHKHYSQEKIETISQSNLIQLIFWIDETLIEKSNNRFILTADENIVVYDNMAYNHYTGECYPPISFLTEFLGYTFPQAAYLLNQFYFKIPKAPLRDVISVVRAQSHAFGTNHDLDLNYILEQDKLISPTDKGYAIKRVIAYLCDTRKIDKDIILNLIKQGYIKLDRLNNICFLTFADPIAKDEVTAITKRGTMTATPYKCNLVKEHNTGFFYARKADLEAQSYENIFVFEGAIDLLSYLSLEKHHYLPAAETPACYIALNGAGNRGYLYRLLEKYPTIQSVTLCLDNDSKGIQAAKLIAEGLGARTQELFMEDFQPILKSVSKNHSYCKDWNDVARLTAEVEDLTVA